MTGYLLDTHVLIWWWLDDPSLSMNVRDLLSSGDGTFHVSAIGGIEIALKVRSGKLPAMAEPLGNFDESIASDGWHHLPVRHDHAIAAGLLPSPHRDPFDRMIAAQALIEELTIVTRDRAFASFGCEVFW